MPRKIYLLICLIFCLTFSVAIFFSINTVLALNGSNTNSNTNTNTSGYVCTNSNINGAQVCVTKLSASNANLTAATPTTPASTIITFASKNVKSCSGRVTVNGSPVTISGWTGTLPLAGTKTVSLLANKNPYKFEFTCTGSTVTKSIDVRVSTKFIRGDADNSQKVNITDVVICFKNFKARNETVAPFNLADNFCPDALDANDSGTITVNDCFDLLSYLFPSTAGKTLPPPFTLAGIDQTPDDIGCMW